MNEGRIFRYLTKPCKKDDLVRAIDLALEYHRKRTEEKKLAKQSIEIKSRVASISKSLLSHDLL